MPRPTTSKKPEFGTARKFLIHGKPGSGKSPLAQSLPWGPTWGEKAVIVATDRKEITLPCPEERYIFADYAGAADPFSFIKEVLNFDWRTEGAGTIIIDTGTVLAQDYLAASIKCGGYNTKAVTFGTETLRLSDKPHYGLAHNLMALTVKEIKKCPLNVIITFWSDQGYGGTWGGPLTVNMNESEALAGEFSNIIHTRTENQSGKTVYLAHTENFGIWVARLGGTMPNPCPIIKMEVDPVNVWHAIDKAHGIK